MGCTATSAAVVVTAPVTATTAPPSDTQAPSLQPLPLRSDNTCTVVEEEQRGSEGAARTKPDGTTTAVPVSSTPTLVQDTLLAMAQQEASGVFRVDPHVFQHRSDVVCVDHRENVLAWMSTVQRCLHLHESVVFLAANVFDRALGAMSINDKESLNDLAWVALVLAAKFLDSHPITYSDLARLGIFLPNPQAVERSVLRALDYRIAAPTAWDFLHVFAARAHVTEDVRAAAVWFARRSLQDIHALGYRPSVVAAGALWVAMHYTSPRRVAQRAIQQVTSPIHINLRRVRACGTHLRTAMITNTKFGDVLCEGRRSPHRLVVQLAREFIHGYDDAESS